MSKRVWTPTTCEAGYFRLASNARVNRTGAARGRARTSGRRYGVLAVALLAWIAATGCDEKGPDAFGPVVSFDGVTGTISGQVTVDGESAPGVTVTLDGVETTTTDDDGRYAFDVSAGIHEVTVTRPEGAECSPESQTVDVPAGGEVTADFTCTSLATTGDLVVTVTGNGDPLEGATVSITGPDSRTGTTGSDGTVTFTGLEPGDYTVDATADGFTCGSTTASVAAGETATAEVSCTST